MFCNFQPQKNSTESISVKMLSRFETVPRLQNCFERESGQLPSALFSRGLYLVASNSLSKVFLLVFIIRKCLN